MTHNIISFSGGKDSTYMLLKMLELKMPIDEIIMFDTEWEFPEMYEHIEKVKNYINMPITVLKDDRGFNYWFSERIKTKGTRKGQVGYGFIDSGTRWCTRLKIWNIGKYLNKKYGKGNYITYKGIAADEPKRAEKEKDINARLPMTHWNITEKEALEYCYSKGFDWGGLYEKFDRVSCWCCPLKRIGELENLYKFYPELWEELEKMQLKSWRKFRKNITVQDLALRFKKVDT